MLNKRAVFADAFNMLCGEKLGSGVHRDVFECKLLPEWVVKVEHDTYRYFANPRECKFWNDHSSYEPVKKWLAPCGNMSPDGRLLLQRRVHMCQPGDKMPETLPAFLTDIKLANFGWLGEQLVCVDYSMYLDNPSLRLKKVTWE